MSGWNFQINRSVVTADAGTATWRLRAATSAEASAAVSGGIPASSADIVGGLPQSATVNLASGDTQKIVHHDVVPNTTPGQGTRVIVFEIIGATPTGSVIDSPPAIGIILEDDNGGLPLIVDTTYNGASPASVPGTFPAIMLYGASGDLAKATVESGLETGYGRFILRDAGASVFFITTSASDLSTSEVTHEYMDVELVWDYDPATGNHSRMQISNGFIVVTKSVGGVESPGANTVTLGRQAFDAGPDISRTVKVEVTNDIVRVHIPKVDGTDEAFEFPRQALPVKNGKFGFRLTGTAAFNTWKPYTGVAA